jgi:arylsulfatase A-like enzyme
MREQSTRLPCPSHLRPRRASPAARWRSPSTSDAPSASCRFSEYPDCYEVVGITPPLEVNGVPQDPIDGVSLAYSFDDPKAKGQMLTQYFEIMGSRSIYHDGWMASAFGPRAPWETGIPPGIREWTPDKDVWELYNLEDDWS